MTNALCDHRDGHSIYLRVDKLRSEDKVERSVIATGVM